jgi:hypothetical protein
MSVTNLDTGETLEAQYNPTGIEVRLEAAYNRVGGPGASYQELQYANTGNTQIPFEINFDGRAPNAPDLNNVQGFFLSLLHPPQDVLGVENGSPPLVLFRWPGWISLVMRHPKLTIAAKRFEPDGPPNYITVKVEQEEARITRLGTENVRRNVLRRAA